MLSLDIKPSVLPLLIQRTKKQMEADSNLVMRFSFFEREGREEKRREKEKDRKIENVCVYVCSEYSH